MRYFYIEPEVAGGLGADTVMDRDSHPPKVSRLHYHLEGWLGDALLESFPCFVIMAAAKDGLIGQGYSGVHFDQVEITVSDEFKELYPQKQLPVFAWLRVTGQAGEDDFGLAKDGRLVVSEAALDTLKRFGISNALVEPF